VGKNDSFDRRQLMKAMYSPNFASVMFVSFLTLVSNPVLSKDTTHLNVEVENLINLESFCMNNDNSSDNQFFYDRQSQSPFSIPKGFSFVVTDIIVFPNCISSGQNESFFTLVLVEDPQVVRKFTAQFSGTDLSRTEKVL
jgi:hypothetical protein